MISRERKKVVISAGGTREAIDPVRFIGNHSSGRQGFALADVAAQRGADVTLVAGAVDALPTPPGVTLRPITSARDLSAAMAEEAEGADVVIMSAAVADFRPAAESDSKLKKGASDDALSRIELVENPDILAETVRRRTVGKLDGDMIIVGFAAETGDASATPLEHATAKLARKGCDLLMCNDVSGGATFGAEDNVGWILDADGSVDEVPHGSKHAVAARILDAVARKVAARG